MRPLTFTELLTVWENGFEQTNIDKALSLLAVATSNTEVESISKWSIEERDIKLFYLRAWMFGNQFVNTATCSNCQEKVEWEMDIKNFSLPPLPLALTENFKFEEQGYSFQFRLPNSEDLTDKNPAKILENCLLALKKNKEPITLAELPKSMIEILGQKMEQVSPLSNISIGLNCPACNHQWEMAFDILSYLWTEIDSWAKKMLNEVYLLANTFKWSEEDILNMSARRRQFYLNRIQS